MDKKAIVKTLQEIAVLLQLTGENTFKVRAYENAARALEQRTESIRTLIDTGELGNIKGIGKELSAKITTLADTGELDYYNDLQAAIPDGLLDLLQIPGLGPKKAKTLYDELGIASLGELEYACHENRLVSLKGFGAKTQQKLLDGIAFVKRNVGKFLHGRSWPTALALRDYVRQAPGVTACELAGSVRRRKEVVKDCDILVAAHDSGPVIEHFLAHDDIDSITGQGDTKCSVRLASGLQVDLRVVAPEAWPFALHYFTGSREHNTALRALAKEHGWKLNEYGLWDGDDCLPAGDEAELFAHFNMSWIPPELREASGELAAAQNGTLPQLVTPRDITGVLHVHSTYSDGSCSLAELRDEAARLGYQYLVICDHSKSAVYAGGLTEEDITRQHAEIDTLNADDNSPVRLCKGIEVDILTDGDIDYDDDVLAAFELVIASVHSRFNLDSETMTQRICRALQHPAVDMIGHPTGRLLLSRAGYSIDVEQLLQTAKTHGKAMELNAHPYRLDLDWQGCKRARELGVPIAINPDAHDLAGFADVEHGVNAARRGWLSRDDVLNTRTWDELQSQLARHERSRP